jgi:CRISPR-associated protein Cmr6
MYPYSGIKLLDLIEKQQQTRAKSDLFRSGEFTLSWRTKVGSFPHPDLETIVAAGEPCGSWQVKAGCSLGKNRPENKRMLEDNLKFLPELPIYGYIPAASIRGVVRAWSMKHPSLKIRMEELLGCQNGDKITAGKIEFLDAFPIKRTKLTLDIVNPQEKFQVFHDGQGTPFSLYTLGNGDDNIVVKVAIRGIANKASNTDVAEVWEWLQQALSLNGVGSRVASGYGSIAAPKGFKASANLPKLPEGYSSQPLSFTLCSQGNAGPDMRNPELRPTHWRGWLRSWLLRFLLGVMSVENAKYTVSELLGTLEDSIDNQGRKGSVNLKLTPGTDWAVSSEGDFFSRFYKWQGNITITAEREILKDIILPIMKFAVMVGGVGRGWRRPLHLFVMDKGKMAGTHAARGCHVDLKYKVKTSAEQWVDKPFGISQNPEKWLQFYNGWLEAVQAQWPARFNNQLPIINAEVFSSSTCAVYMVDGPDEDPIEGLKKWSTDTPTDTRGDGMGLIYKPIYKRKVDVGGNAGNGSASCSWVSIKRSKRQEIVCIFMGQNNSLRQQFLQDLQALPNSSYLFGIQPTQ